MFTDELTKEMVEYLERKHNVYIDAETNVFNLDSRDAIYGWIPIPKEWIDEARKIIIE